MTKVKARALNEQDGSQKTDSQPPAKRVKVEKSGRDASFKSKNDSPRKANEKGPINLKAPVNVPYNAFINKRAEGLFKQVTVTPTE